MTFFSLLLVDSNFRNGLFKLTALLIYNTNVHENENEFSYSMMGGTTNQTQERRGNSPADFINRWVSNEFC